MKSYINSNLSFRALRSAFIVIFLFTHFSFAFAQQKIFSPSVENEALLKSIHISLERYYQKDLADIPSENKKDFLKIYKQRWDNLQDKFDKKEIYTNPQAQRYLDAILSEIVKQNHLLQGKELHCYFSRSGVPNAEYLGEGLILFNMGLFTRLDNESQVAFILCHELAHYYLRHSENSIQKYVSTINSPEVQKELRNIKKKEFGKREELEQLLKGLTFDSRRHGRDHESSADSMGIEFLRNTHFSVSESLTTLALLDSIDRGTLETGEVLEQLFNSKEYPFKKKWIHKEEGLLGGHAHLKEDKSIADSLKTHPDCRLRINALRPMVVKYQSPSSSKNIIGQSEFDQLKNIFRYEIIEYTFISQNYTKSLQYTIELLQEKPADPYLVTQVGKIFNGFYNAQKTHTLSKVTELPAPFFQSNYNLLLQFVQNLFLEDYANIGYYFLEKFVPQMEGYEPFKNTYNTSISTIKTIKK